MYDFEENWTLFKFPEFEEIALSDSRVSEEVRSACDAIIASDSAYRLQELEALAGTWDGSFLVETKHKDLKQVDNPPKIPSKGWKCEAEGCPFTVKSQCQFRQTSLDERRVALLSPFILHYFLQA